MIQRTPRGAIVSWFGDISPASAAAFGASVDVALPLDARRAEARAMASAAREPRQTSRRDVLPVEIATTRAVPASRVQVDIKPAHRSPAARR